MIRTDLPIVRGLLDLGKAFPENSRERQTIADAAEVLGACAEACERAIDHAGCHNDYDWIGAANAALADARRDYSTVVLPK